MTNHPAGAQTNTVDLTYPPGDLRSHFLCAKDLPKGTLIPHPQS